MSLDVDAGRLSRLEGQLRSLELVSVTNFAEHALAAIPILTESIDDCADGHDECLAVHVRSGGRYFAIHLTRPEARRVAHQLYYRSIEDAAGDWSWQELDEGAGKVVGVARVESNEPTTTPAVQLSTGVAVVLRPAVPAH